MQGRHTISCNSRNQAQMLKEQALASADACKVQVQKLIYLITP